MGLFARLRRVAALLADPRTPKLPRVVVALAALYLIWPIDLVPEAFLPVAGWIDDIVLLWFSLRWLLAGGSPDERPANGSGPPPDTRG